METRSRKVQEEEVQVLWKREIKVLLEYFALFFFFGL